MVKLLCGKLLYVQVSLTGTNILKQIEKFSEMGIILKNINRTTVSSVTFWVTRNEYNIIKGELSRDAYKISIISKKGLLFYLLSFKKRYALIFGLIFGIICLSVLSKRVWVVRVHGTENVDFIKEIAVSSGILDWHGRINNKVLDIEQAISESDLNIIWNTVEVKGAVADIYVKEGKIKPKSEFNEKIVASKDCVIKNLIVEKGTATAVNGQTVSKGQTLIDGKTIIGENEYTTSAEGKAYASVFYVAGQQMPLSEEVFTKTGLWETKTEIKIFGLDIVSNNKVDFENYKTEENEVNTWFLPIKIKKITYFETKASIINHDAETLKLQTEKDLVNKLKSEIPQNANFYEIKTTAEEKDGMLLVTTYIETIENVAIRG